MKATLQVGLEHQLQFQVPASKTVPALYPESPEFRAMPEVFATGFLVGLLEWACIQAVKPHLDWPADATERRQFDRVIADFQGVSFLLADMATGIEAGRALYLAAARRRDAGQPYSKPRCCRSSKAPTRSSAWPSAAP